MKGVTTGVPYALVNAFVVMLVEMHGVMLVVMHGVMLVVMHGVMHGVITAVLQARLRKTAGAPPMWTSHVGCSEFISAAHHSSFGASFVC